MVSGSGQTPAKLPFEMLSDQLMRLQRDVQGTRTSTRRLVVAVGGLAAGLVLCTALLVWWTTPPVNYTPAFVAIDTVLVEAWKSLPKDLQGKLELAYRAGQVRPPSERSK